MAAMKFVILLFAIAAVVSSADVQKSEKLESSDTVGLGYYGGYYGANPYYHGYGGYGYSGYPYSAYNGYGGYYPYGHHGFHGYYR